MSLKSVWGRERGSHSFSDVVKMKPSTEVL